MTIRRASTGWKPFFVSLCWICEIELTPLQCPI
nr:MAG TPA: hypothetical protein [Caudoviricetes sp.]